MDLVLVSCVSKKQNRAMPARDLYISDWFLKASAYAARLSPRWFILSAKYGLVHPGQVIAPYNITLKKMTAEERRRWAAGVLASLQPHLQDTGRVIFLAGLVYRENLVVPIRNRGHEIIIPMEGMRIGEQLQWLK